MFEKIETACPHCGRTNTFEVACVGKGCSLKSFTCTFCSKNWQENLGSTRKLAKSASNDAAELSKLRAELAAQFEELTQKINAILAQRDAAARKFQPNGVEKSGVAEQELQKALANGRPAGVGLEEIDSASPRFQPVFSTGTFERRRGSSELQAEKTDAADEELRKALWNPVPVGGRFIPRG